ncbi:MAG: VCBS repeat-containing protein [Planctomycetes bacterium]|nr:VCBS repeat-containing protein [Planctomycetota bacterium]
MQHWLGRVERIHLMLYFQRHGLAVADVNGDGLDDLYVCQPGGLPNRLFLQRPDGTASEASASARVDWLDHTASALLVDLDNDGDQDLVLATAEGVQVLANDGRARFDPVLTLATADSDLHSLCAADYDGDGDLDLYVTCDYARARARPGEKRQPFSYHDANDGGANLLFRNDHDPARPGVWKFTDVTKSSGLDENNRRHSLAASWADYDGDGDLDLYVANDYGQNCLYRNTDGRFVDVAAEAGVVDQGSGMSVSWADFNHDGRLDLYVGNMFSSAGSRITRQAKFRADQSGDVRSIYQRFTKGNSLFSNTGDGKFDEVGATAGVEMGRWAWSSIFADINNDGWQDLIVANGFVTTDDPGDL